MITLISLSLPLALLTLNLTDPTLPKTNGEVTFTVIYDNTTSDPAYKCDWGFACLIEGKDKTILFDTGTKPDIFRENLEKLNIDLNKVDLVVISHNHGDHTGGLPVVLEKRKDLPVYIPASVEDDFLIKYPEFNGHTMRVDKPVKLCIGATLTGEMGKRIKEHSLIVETSKGLVVVCGCSHQGIVEIIKRTKELSDQPIHLVFGGFHLMDHSDQQVKGIIREFKKADVEYCGATHCTGDKQIKLFAEAYGDHYVPIGSGRKIIIP